jgi:shikimate kinase
MQQPIVLTGFMSSGKTTVAAALGKRLACSAIDLDDVVTAAEGRTPKEIIEQNGEDAFREAETRLLHEILTAETATVIALGGGAWIVGRNRELIGRNKGISVWLDAPFELCWKRIPAGGGERPLARGHDEARNLYQQRQPYYALAQIRVEVADKSIEEIAEEIAAAVSLRRWESSA